ncbi:MAG: alpha/beta fold hydrolase [Myxococcales bacterium]|nr:alpha/beta fold hydrolase [Myxococcales bacterium]
MLRTACWTARGAMGAALALACSTQATSDTGYQNLGGGGAGTSTSTSTTTASGTTSTTSTTTGAGGAEPDGKGPPYPLVLAHGFFGFEDFAGLGFVDYFWHVKPHLASVGEIVYTPAVDPFNDSAFRGEQLALAISGILAHTGYRKVNLVGHSQGGLDARYVAHVYPDMVASVVTLQTPHAGTPIADIALKVLSDPSLNDVLDLLLLLAGQPLWNQIGDTTSLAKPMYLFSQQGIAEFNATYTDQPGIYYASVAGRSSHDPGGADCEGGSAGFIAATSGYLDPIEPLLAATAAVLGGGPGESIPNDGLVRARDAKWGEFLGCVPADHMDLIGHLFGDAPGGTNHFDYQAFYVNLVAWLRHQGL